MNNKKWYFVEIETSDLLGNKYVGLTKGINEEEAEAKVQLCNAFPFDAEITLMKQISDFDANILKKYIPLLY